MILVHLISHWNNIHKSRDEKKKAFLIIVSEVRKSIKASNKTWNVSSILLFPLGLFTEQKAIPHDLIPRTNLQMGESRGLLFALTKLAIGLNSFRFELWFFFVWNFARNFSVSVLRKRIFIVTYFSFNGFGFE